MTYKECLAYDRKHETHPAHRRFSSAPQRSRGARVARHRGQRQHPGAGVAAETGAARNHRSATTNGAWIVSYDKGYPVGRFEAAAKK
jgi:hypothetical protein